jgi:hypothetical protein
LEYYRQLVDSLERGAARRKASINEGHEQHRIVIPKLRFQRKIPAAQQTKAFDSLYLVALQQLQLAIVVSGMSSLASNWQFQAPFMSLLMLTSLLI